MRDLGGNVSVRFDLHRPCGACPFRKPTEGAPGLRVSPASARAFAKNETFVCHQTAEVREGGYEPKRDGTSQHCAGHLAFHEKHGAPTQMMRIYERLRIYDATKIRKPETLALVWDSLTEWIRKGTMR